MRQLRFANVTRRHVLVGITGATAIAGGSGLWLVSRRVRGWRYRNAVERGSAFAPNVYLAVEPTGDVVIWLVRAEMGQGVETALPMLVAEELDADWQRVRVERAVVDERYDYGPMPTVASGSIRSMWTELRRAGATARHMIMAAAADTWDVPVSELVTDNGAVTHAASGRRATYGDLADLSAAQRPPLRPRLKSPNEFRLIGRAVARRDLPAKIAGTAVFGIDVRVANMRYAAIARSPTIGGRVVAIDDTAARAVEGVLDVVQVPTGVAVVGSNSYSALRGRDLLEVQWQSSTAPISSDAISAALHAALSAGEAMVARDDGGSAAAPPGRPTQSADYEVPYLAHAPMEPMNCVASVTHDRCEIWAPTQTPDDARDTAAHVAGLPRDRVTVHTTYLGGGFGRRAATDFVAEAVDLAKRTGAPVQVLWSREDDMRHGMYRPAVAQRIEAAIDDAGSPIAWRHRIANVRPGSTSSIDDTALMGADDLPYAVGPIRIEWSGVHVPIPTTIWRSVGHSFTTFAIESFLDELAHSTGRDPVAYRLSLLTAGSRLRRCIEEVAQMSGWQSSDRTRSLGLAAAQCFGSYIALVVEVAPSASNPFQVVKAWCAVDCGIVVNPDGAAAQVEGGILFGLTAALVGRITVDQGSIVEGNFDRYPLLRIDAAPDIEIRFVPSSEPPGGVGEIGVPTVAPAVANAVFAARGTRLRTLPLALTAPSAEV